MMGLMRQNTKHKQLVRATARELRCNIEMAEPMPKPKY